MKNLRLKQFGITFFAVLSLLVSSVAACACSHHQIQKQAEVSSCHQHPAAMSEMETTNNETVSVPRIEIDCGCFVRTFQPFVVGKTETVKKQKTNHVLPESPSGKMRLAVSETPVVEIVFESHFYNSNRLVKLTPSRAPPVS